MQYKLVGYTGACPHGTALLYFENKDSVRVKLPVVGTNEVQVFITLGNET